MRISPIFIALAASAGIAGAASVNIINPGFEDDVALVQGSGGWSDAVPNGWSDPQGGDNTNFMETIGGFASDGLAHLGFDGNEFGLIYQDLGTAWAANTTYTFTVGVGNRANWGAGTGRFSLTSSLDALPAPGAVGGPYTLYTPSGFFSDLDTSTIAPAGGTFGDATFSWTTGAVAPAGNLRISVQNLTGTRLHIDNIRLDATAIPEPTASVLGLLGAAFVLRRRRA
jgi:hypothetical protein